MALIKRQATSTAAKSTKAADPFASKFNQAAKDNPVGNYESLPVGIWEALACNGGLFEKDGKKSAWIDFHVTQEGASCFGKSGRSFSTLEDAEGNFNEIGAAILARNLTDMGKLDEDGIKSEAHLVSVLESFKDEPVWVSIHVSVKKGYTNIRIEKVMENQEDKPEIDAIPMD